MGPSFFLTFCLQGQFTFVVGSRAEAVASPDLVWGVISQGLSYDGDGRDFNRV